MMWIKKYCPALAPLFLLSGCILEDVFPCPKSGVELQYDYVLNMDYKDLLTPQVSELRSFVFDEEGVLDTILTTSVANGLDGNGLYSVQLEPGNYQILTWAGDRNVEESFRFMHANNPDDPASEGVVAGQTRLADLRVFLRCKEDAGEGNRLTPQTGEFGNLFYGQIQQVEVKPQMYTKVKTSLIRDSKIIRVKVKNLSAIHTPVPGKTDFDFVLTAHNGHYNSNNITGETSNLITYTPYATVLDNDTIQADIKTLRLRKTDEAEPYTKPLLLSVTCQTGNITVCKELDVVDLILNSKIPSRDSEGNIRKDADGNILWVYPTLEYLDRQDLFEITFVREKPIPPSGGGDLGFTIYVNGWRIVNMIPDLDD